MLCSEIYREKNVKKNPCSVTKSCQILCDPWTAAYQAPLCLTISQSLLKLTFTELMMSIQPSHPLSPPSPPVLNLSQHHGLF